VHIKAAGVFTLVVLVAAPIAYMSMFGGFQAYDDEGYMLVTLRDYLAGHPLLTPYLALYGPFFYELVGGLFKLLGIIPTNDSGRLFSIVVWLASSVVAGLATYRLTWNLAVGVVGQLVTFSLLAVLAQEPMTTYGLISLLLAGLVLVATYRLEKPRATAVLVGAIVGALCMLKINVGAFAGLAVLMAWAGSLTPVWRRFVLPAIAGVITLAPFTLTSALLGRGWVLELALFVSLSTASVAIAYVAAEPRSEPPSSTGWLLLGGLGLVAASLGIALAGGSRPVDVWNDLVVRAVRFPQLFTLPVNINPLADAWAVVSVAVAVATFGPLRHARVPASAAGAARIASGLYMLLSILLLPSWIFLLGLPLAWIAIRPPGADAAGSYCRILLAALAVIGSLQIYPVAGSQLALAALVMVPLGAVILTDGIAQLLSSPASAAPWRRLAAWATPSAFAVTVTILILSGYLTEGRFESGSPSGLAGAESVRMPAQQGAQLRELVGGIERDCSAFITYPGMNSLYVWTGQEPATPLRYGVWWLVPDVNDEQLIVQQLEGRPRLCVVKNQTLIDFWAQGRAVPPSPLVAFIDQNFVEKRSYGDYALLVRRT